MSSNERLSPSDAIQQAMKMRTDTPDMMKARLQELRRISDAIQVQSRQPEQQRDEPPADQPHTPNETHFTRFRYTDGHPITRDDLILAFTQPGKGDQIRYLVRDQGGLTQKEREILTQALQSAHPDVYNLSASSITSALYRQIQRAKMEENK